MSSIAATVFLSNQEKAMLKTMGKGWSEIAETAADADDVVTRHVTTGWY
jgi:type IV secretion system protein VirB4